MSGWARVVPKGAPHYEVSSRGDVRFSALYAKLKAFGGLSIEHLYQVGLKGYPSIMAAKGKPPLKNIDPDMLYAKYKELWVMYLDENPGLLEDLRTRSNGRTLTDMFATTANNQARALAEILAESEQPPMDNIGTSNKPTISEGDI
jgi:hypothetical protein